MNTILTRDEMHPARADFSVETMLTAYDTNYAWNYSSMKEGLRDLYEKARESSGMVRSN